MGDYLRQPLRETDVHFIVNEITAFADCVETKQMLLGALTLPPRIGVDLEQEYRHNGYNSYGYFTGMISKWINLKGTEASTAELDKALRAIGWNAAADNLKAKWSSDITLTAGLGNFHTLSIPEPPHRVGLLNSSSVQNSSLSHNVIIGQQIVHGNAPLTKFNPVWFNMKEPIPSFTGRKKTLQEVHNIFFPTNSEIKPIHQIAIVGPGGVGKSEFAREVAHKYYTEFDGNVIWINAQSDKLIIDCFKELAVHIGISSKQRELPENIEIYNMCNHVYDYFSERNVLFIFNNAEFHEKNALKDYLPVISRPALKKLFVLFTSQKRPMGIKIVELSVFEEEEAVELIQKRLEIKNAELASELANLLGCLPSAIQQAIAYIQHEVGIFVEKGVKSYIARFADDWEILLDYKSTTDIELEELKTTLQTCRTTLMKIHEANPNATLLLKMMSCISPDSIHLEIFQSHFTNDNLRDAINTLLQFCIINKSSASSSIVSLPRLVHLIMRLDQKETFKNSLEQMLNLLNLLLKLLAANITPYATSCVIHAQVAWRHALAYPDLVKQFNNFSEKLHEKGKLYEMHQANLSLFQQTLLKYKQLTIYGESSEEYIMVQDFIASATMHLNKYEDAKLLFKSIHKTAAVNLGDSHKLTIEALGNLAAVEGSLGNYPEQAIILNKVITAYIASLNFGPHHKNTLTSLHNKAACLANMKKYKDALELFKSTLKLKEKHHPENRDLINATKCWVASMTRREGNTLEALTMYKSIHAERVQSLGESHSNTLLCAYEIGNCLWKLEKLEDAMEILNYSLDLAKKNPSADRLCNEIFATRERLAAALQNGGSTGTALR